MSGFFTRYGKPIIAVVVAAALAFKSYFGDQHIDPAEGVAIALTLANAVMVWLVPLFPGYRWLKTVVGVAIAALTALSSVILAGVTTDEVVLVVMAAVQALGVAVAPAVSDNGTAVAVRGTY